MTIHEKTPGALIASSERTVATFESGLCRVDQTYTCASANAATHRSTLAIDSTMPDGNNAPTVDGLYIFPSPQESKRQDGFTDFIVSAYGRTPFSNSNFVQSVITQNATNPPPKQGATEQFLPFFFSKYETSGSAAIKRGVKFEYFDLGLEPEFSDLFNFNSVTTINEVYNVAISQPIPFVSKTINWDGFVLDQYYRKYIVTMKEIATEAISTTEMIVINPRIQVQSTKNFGRFQEIDFTASPTILAVAVQQF